MEKDKHPGGDSVAILVARLQEGNASASVQGRADRVFRRAEPAARATCRVHVSSVTAPSRPLAGARSVIPSAPKRCRILSIDRNSTVAPTASPCR
jgi:hypothetical protein